MTKELFEQQLPELLKKLTPEQQPLWGIMTPQHMVEHLIITWKLSRARFPVQLINDKDLDKKKAFLMSDKPYEKNLKIPALEGKLQKLRFPDLPSAIAALVTEIPQFHTYFEENPTMKPINPVFGPLNKEEWYQLHFKHSSHHLAQFNLK